MDAWFIYEGIIGWISEHGLRLALIVTGALIAHQLLVSFVERTMARASLGDENGTVSIKERNARRKTLMRVIDVVAKIALWIIATILILSEIGVSIGPLLATAGVAGLAISLGAQSVIKDMLTGFFILMENQYTIGDVVCIDDTCGNVEDITMRKTILRDFDGVRHHIPHGEIKRVSNKTQEFSRVNLDIGVGYDTPIEKLELLVNKVGEDMAGDPDWKKFFIKAPKFLWIREFADSAIVVRIQCEIEPGEQWNIAGELRKRLKIAFDAHGIEIPFPQRVVHVQNSTTQKSGLHS